LSVDIVKDIIYQNNRDVCQIGLDIAEKFSTTQEDYEKIWTIIQDDCGYSFTEEIYKRAPKKKNIR